MVLSTQFTEGKKSASKIDFIFDISTLECTRHAVWNFPIYLFILFMLASETTTSQLSERAYKTYMKKKENKFPSVRF